MKALYIGDKVRIKDTGFKGEIIGVGNTLHFHSACEGPRAISIPTYIIRLSTTFLIVPTPKYAGSPLDPAFRVVEGRAPSSFPGSLFVHELTRSLDQLELDE